MEVEFTAECTEKELNMFRNLMNSKIDIFQSNDGYVFRNNKVTQKFYDSFEHSQMQNNAAKILLSASNTLLYSIAKDSGDMIVSQNNLKRAFTQTKTPEEYDAIYVEAQHSQFKKKVMRKKLENDPEYKQLCEFLDNPRFTQAMAENRAFLRYILNHKYFPYHPRYEEINDKYKKLLCPIFSSTQTSNTSSTQNQGNNQINDEDEEMNEEEMEG